MSIEYRKVLPNDFLQISEIDRLSWKENENSEFIPDGEHAWRLWCEYAVVFGCFKDDRIIGAALTFKSEFEELYAIHKIFVLNEHRGEGHGSALMEMTLDYINEKKSRAFLTVDPQNKNAIALYTKMGFTQKKLVKGYYRNYEDRFIMEYSSK